MAFIRSRVRAAGRDLSRPDPARPLPQLGIGAVIFIAAHVPLGLLMQRVSMITSLHAMLVVGLGFYWACSSRPLAQVALFAAYITGAEVLWRMTNDQLFWEIAKYSVTAILGLALLREHGLKSLAWPLLAFGLLVPSASLTMTEYQWADARNALSFNLSGPFALVMCARFYSYVKLSPGQFQRLLVSWIAPAVAMASFVILNILINPNIKITHESNFDLSGGFGPNQVSSALGLASMLALMFLLEKGSSWELRLTMFGLMLWMFFQAAFTFSRGGVFCAIGGALTLFACMTRDPRALVRGLVAFALVGLVGYYVVWPRMDAFTDGALSERFTEENTTGRAELTETDLDIFVQHPGLGVGPGLSKLEHHDELVAHTEFTRLLAEHGLFGLSAIALLMISGYLNFRRAVTAREKGLGAAMMVWSVLFMLNSAMRLVAPAFTFGCGFATLETDDKALASEPAPRPRRVRRTLAYAP